MSEKISVPKKKKKKKTQFPKKFQFQNISVSKYFSSIVISIPKKISVPKNFSFIKNSIIIIIVIIFYKLQSYVK